MNNEQFRKLLLADAAKESSQVSGTPSVASKGGASIALGSRQKSSIPMTPRSLGGRPDFARQLAERNQAANPKKFRSSAPKGIKLGDGYTDRTRTRQEEDEDDRETRIKALEESFKKEEIDQVTFEKLRSQIAGGDLSSTHLIKGLDYKLLARVKKGEDVYNSSGDKDGDKESSPEPDVDDELDRLEGENVTAIAKEKTGKKGQLSTVSLTPGKKRTRDQILAELKASRQAAKETAEPALGDRFRKIGAVQKAGTRIERDSKGREVLIIVDEDGHEKRKVRKVQPDAESRKEFVPKKDAEVLGMEVPEAYRKQQEAEEEEEEDIDIFADAGDDYDPLAGLGAGSDSDSESDEDGEVKAIPKPAADDKAAMPPPPLPSNVPAAEPRNYFKDSKTSLISEERVKAPLWSDPSMKAALKKAASIKPIDDEADEDDPEAQARKERHRKMLQQADRDDEDLDMGFGTSRFEDEEDFDDKKVKLSKWGEEDDGGEKGRTGKSQRKRGPKKRKGDVNSAADVLRVMEQRRAGSG